MEPTVKPPSNWGAMLRGALAGALVFVCELWVRLVYLYAYTSERAPADYAPVFAAYVAVGAVGLPLFAVAARAWRRVGRRSGRRRWLWLGLVLLAVLFSALLALRWIANLTELMPRDAVRHLGATLGLTTAYLVAFCLVGWSIRALRRPLLAGLWVGVVGGSVLGQLLLLAQFDWERVGRGLPESRGGRGPNVLLLTVDTLRTDALGAYGGTNPTPEVDRLAAEGVLFERAIAQSPWTRPSFGSLLTSRYPSQHGAFVTNRAGEGEEIARQVFSGGLGAAGETLAERLSARGYRTVAFQSNRQASAAHGFDRGFDLFVHGGLFATSFWTRSALGYYLAEGRAVLVHGRRRIPFWAAAPPASVVFDAFEELYARGIGEPWFLWINVMDPHSPYHVWDPELPPESSRPIHFVDTRDPEASVAALREAYDSEVRYTDHFVGRTLELLEREGQAERTLVVFSSDHGEEFGDHGAELHLSGRRVSGRHHGHSLYNELLQVPLILRLPGVLPAGRRVASMVRLIDVLPTILDLVGASDPDNAIEGVSLLPSLDPTAGPTEERLAFSERLYYGLEQKAVQSDRLKLIAHLEPPRLELFEIDMDPHETRNRIEAGIPGADDLLAALHDWMGRMPEDAEDGTGVEEALSAEERARLRALGYVQ